MHRPLLIANVTGIKLQEPYEVVSIIKKSNWYDFIPQALRNKGDAKRLCLSMLRTAEAPSLSWVVHKVQGDDKILGPNSSS